MINTRTRLCARLVCDAMLGALGVHHQSMSATPSFGQGALGRTQAHTSFPPGGVLQEICFPGHLGAAVLPSQAAGSPWGDMDTLQWASADPVFCTFPAALRIVLASLFDNFFPEQTPGGIYKVYKGVEPGCKRGLQAGQPAWLLPSLLPTCSPPCHQSKLY